MKRLSFVQHKDIIEKYKSELNSNNDGHKIKLLGDIIKRIISLDNNFDLFSCNICTDELNIDNIYVISGCKHFFCQGCITEYCCSKINNGECIIKCPLIHCANNFTDNELRSIFKDTKIILYETLLLNYYAANTKHAVFCPRPECGKLCFKNKCDSTVFCLFCHCQFCMVCKKYAHENHTCVIENLDKKLNKYLKNENMRMCPNCKMFLTKDNGCNAVTCINCKTKFCWLCLELKDDLDGKHRCDDYYSEDETSSSSESDADTDDD